MFIKRIFHGMKNLNLFVKFYVEVFMSISHIQVIVLLFNFVGPFQSQSRVTWEFVVVSPKLLGLNMGWFACFNNPIIAVINQI
jgi:hypothetical protein